MTILGFFTLMNKLLVYYQRELDLLKQHGKIFAKKFPKIAHRLGIVEGVSEDPHVSRLIESFALLTSRIHQRLDEDLPEVVEGVLHAIAPQFLYPIPSLCIVQITPDPKRSGLTGKNEFPAKTTLLSRQSDPACQFQTAYPVTLLPISVVNAGLYFEKEKLNWQLNICFNVWPGSVFNNDKIRLYLHGNRTLSNTLYTLLCSELIELSLLYGGKNSSLPVGDVSPTGFEIDASLLMRIPKIAPVHALLLDFFHFPQKFLFIDIKLPSGLSIGGDGFFELKFSFRKNMFSEGLGKIAELVNKECFLLHCTPAINLFQMNAEPITLNSAMSEYPVIPNARNSSHFEVWDVHSIFMQQKKNNQVKPVLVPPLIESHNEILNKDSSGLFWQSFRREHERLPNTEYKHFIALSEAKDRPETSDKEVLNINVLCTNHSIPNHIKYGDPEGDFITDVSIAALKIIAITHPTHPINPPDKNSTRWRFLSQLSLNLQLIGGEDGVYRLKEILTLYNFDEVKNTIPLVKLIHTLTCQPVTARIIKNNPHTLARGIDITLGFHHSAISEPEYYLFCSLMDHFFALYAPVNSFTRLITFIEEHEMQTRYVWPIRAGKLSWL